MYETKHVAIYPKILEDNDWAAKLCLGSVVDVNGGVCLLGVYNSIRTEYLT